MKTRTLYGLLLLASFSLMGCVETTVGLEPPDDSPIIRTVTGWQWPEDGSEKRVVIWIDRWITPLTGPGDGRAGSEPYFAVKPDSVFKEVEKGAVRAREEDLEVGQTVHLWQGLFGGITEVAIQARIVRD